MAREFLILICCVENDDNDHGFMLIIGVKEKLCGEVLLLIHPYFYIGRSLYSCHRRQVILIDNVLYSYHCRYYTFTKVLEYDHSEYETVLGCECCHRNVLSEPEYLFVDDYDYM